MDEYITKGIAQKIIEAAVTKHDALMMIDGIPDVDVIPVRHGRWIKKRYWSEGVGMGESYGYWYACSECNHEVKSGYGGCSDKFCTECGADMRKDGDNG